MRTRSQSRNNFPQQEASPVIVEPLRIELPFLEDQFQEDPPVDPPEVPMADNRIMAKLLQAPIEGYEDAIVILEIVANNFELKHVRQSRAKAVVAKVSTSSSTPAISSEVFELKDLVRALLLDKKNQSSAPASSPAPAPVKAIEPSCVTCGGTHSYQNYPVNQPPAYQAPAYQAPIPQTQSVSQTDFERYVKANDTVMSNMQNQGQNVQNQLANLTDMLSKFTSSNTASSSWSGTLPSNNITNPKEDLKGMEECLALADLGASINLMPLSVWNGLSLLELTLTCMTLELADRSVSKPIGIAKDISVKVGVFHFPADFVVVDFEPDHRVPLILGRCFLKTGRALIDVYKGELTLRIGKEAITYNLDQTVRYSANYDQMTANKIDVICEIYSQEVLGFSDVTGSGNPTPYDDLIVSTTSPTLTSFGDSDFLLFEEADAFFGLEDDPNSSKFDPSYYDPEGDILLLESILNTKTVKSSVDEPPEVELKDLPPHIEYAFLEGDNKLPVIIAKELGDEEKSTLIKVLKYHKRAIAWKLSDIQAVKVTVQIQFDRLRDEAQAKNEDYLNKLDENIQKIIKEQVKEQVKVQVFKILPKIEKTINEKLEAKVLTRLSNSSKIKMKNPPMDQTGGPGEEEKEKRHSAARHQSVAEASQHPEWFQIQKKPPTPDRAWNKTFPATHGSIQPWISDLDKQADTHTSFSELMDTLVDILAFLMNWLNVDTLTPKLLAGLTYELMKGSCMSLVELKFFLEEVYKATTDQLDWNNPEGQQYSHNLLKPLPLIPNFRGRHVIPFDHFINNDLEYLRGGASSRKYTTSVTKTKAADYGHIKWIEDLAPRTMWSQAPVNYDKYALWGISHWGLKCQQFYGFTVNKDFARDVYSKRDLKRLHIQDIKDMLLLLAQGKLTNVTVKVCFALNVSLRMFTRSIGIQQRMEDLQLGVKSYQKKLNLTKPDTYISNLKRTEAYIAYSNPREFIYQNKDKQNRLTRIDELHKFSDGTLNDIRTDLDDRLKGIQNKYLPQTIWRRSDKERAAATI
nr:reverse transcriptase domain-containing protein [Tanacetum cinerariifolium]